MCDDKGGVLFEILNFCCYKKPGINLKIKLRTQHFLNENNKHDKDSFGFN